MDYDQIAGIIRRRCCQAENVERSERVRQAVYQIKSISNRDLTRNN